MERKLMIWSTILILIAFGVAAYFSPQEVRYSVNTEHQISYGSKDAKVEVIVFEEFACPQCRRFHNEAIKPLFTKYVDKKKVRLTIIPIAYLDNSYPAFSAACCIGKVGANHMKAFLDSVFNMPHKQLADASARELTVAYAMKEGQFPTSDVMDCVKSEAIQELRESRNDLAGSFYGEEVHLPTILVNGKMVPLADQVALFNTIENELLKESRGKK